MTTNQAEPESKEVKDNSDFIKKSNSNSSSENGTISKQRQHHHSEYNHIEDNDNEDIEINFNNNINIILFSNSCPEYVWCVRLLSLEKLHILSQYYNAVLSTLGGAYSATRQHQVALILAQKQERVAIRLGKMDDIIKAKVWQALNLGLMSPVASNNNNNNNDNNNNNLRRKGCKYLNSCVRIMRFVLQTAKDMESPTMIAHIHNNYHWLRSQIALRNSSSSSNVDASSSIDSRRNFIGS